MWMVDTKMPIRTDYVCPKCGTNLYVYESTMKYVDGKSIPDEIYIMCPKSCDLSEEDKK